MSLIFRLGAVAGMIVYVLAVPVAAENAAPESAKKKADPNEVVCERQQVLGSRLAVRKVCMTRSQWAEQRQANRDLVEKAQLGSCVRQAGC